MVESMQTGPLKFKAEEDWNNAYTLRITHDTAEEFSNASSGSEECTFVVDSTVVKVEPLHGKIIW